MSRTTKRPAKPTVEDVTNVANSAREVLQEKTPSSEVELEEEELEEELEELEEELEEEEAAPAPVAVAKKAPAKAVSAQATMAPKAASTVKIKALETETVRVGKETYRIVEGKVYEVPAHVAGAMQHGKLAVKL